MGRIFQRCRHRRQPGAFVVSDYYCRVLSIGQTHVYANNQKYLRFSTGEKPAGRGHYSVDGDQPHIRNSTEAWIIPTLNVVVFVFTKLDYHRRSWWLAYT